MLSPRGLVLAVFFCCLEGFMATALKAALLKVRGILAAIAPITPLKLDDTLVLVIDAGLADAELFGWFQAKVEADAAGTLAIETEPSAALQISLAKRGLTFGQVAAALPAILELLRLIRG